MSHLRLVTNDYLDPMGLYRELSDLVGFDADVSHRTYGKSKLFVIDLQESEESFVRVIFDFKREHASRPGMRASYPDSASELLDKINKALKDNFTTIWIS